MSKPFSSVRPKGPQRVDAQKSVLLQLSEDDNNKKKKKSNNNNNKKKKLMIRRKKTRRSRLLSCSVPRMTFVHI